MVQHAREKGCWERGAIESQNAGRGRWGNKSPVVQDKIRSLEAALSALGPEEIAAKEPLQEAPRRAREVSQPMRGDPDTIKTEAVAKVDRLQKALDVFEISRGARGRCHQESIAQGPRRRQRTTRFRTYPRVQGFHGAFHQAHRQVEVGVEAETGLLEQSRARLARLEVQQAGPVRDFVVGDGPQVSSLQQMVIQLQAERDSLSQELRRSRAPQARPCGDGPPNVSDIPPLPDQAQDVEQ